MTVDLVKSYNHTQHLQHKEKNLSYVIGGGGPRSATVKLHPTQVDALPSVKRLIIKFSSTVLCMVISVHVHYYLLKNAICLLKSR